MSGARQMRRAPSLHQWETHIKANSDEASNESNLDTPYLKRDKSVKEMMQEIRKARKDKEAYMQDVPEAAYRDSAFTDSIKSVIKISEYCRNPVECGNSIQITKRTEERNADLVTSLAEQSSAKQNQKKTPRLLSNLARSSGRQSPETLNKGRQYHVLPILPCRQES